MKDDIRNEYNEYQKDHYIGSLNYEYDQTSQHVNNFEELGEWKNNLRPVNLKNNILIDDKKH